MLIHANDESEQYMSVKKNIIAGFSHHVFLNDTIENTYPSFFSNFKNQIRTDAIELLVIDLDFYFI